MIIDDSYAEKLSLYLLQLRTGLADRDIFLLVFELVDVESYPLWMHDYIYDWLYGYWFYLY